MLIQVSGSSFFRYCRKTCLSSGSCGSFSVGKMSYSSVRLTSLCTCTGLSSGISIGISTGCKSVSCSWSDIIRLSRFDDSTALAVATWSLLTPFVSWLLATDWNFYILSGRLNSSCFCRGFGFGASRCIFSAKLLITSQYPRYLWSFSRM